MYFYFNKYNCLPVDLTTAGFVSNSAAPDQIQYSLASNSDLGLDCLVRLPCPKTSGSICSKHP